MEMKKLSALILCFTMLLSMSFSAEVYAHEEDIMRTENYQKTNVKYYRLSHQYILSGNYYYCKCCGYKNPTMVVSGVTK